MNYDSGHEEDARDFDKKGHEDMNAKKGILKQLFFSSLYLSAFTFGGGYVIVTLLKKKFVDELHWIEENEMLDMVAIAQSSPGPIAVNGAIVVGYKLAGFPGIFLSVLGAVIPPVVILTVISFFYQAFRSNMAVQAVLTGMKSGVGAVIVSVVYEMGSGVVKTKDWVLMLVMLFAFLANYVWKVNVVLIILAVAGIGAVRTIAAQRRNQPVQKSGEKPQKPDQSQVVQQPDERTKKGGADQ